MVIRFQFSEHNWAVCCNSENSGRVFSIKLSSLIHSCLSCLSCRKKQWLKELSENIEMDRFISSNAPNPRWLWCTPALTMNTLHSSPRSWLLQNWIQIFLSGLSDNIFNQCSAATAALGAAVTAVNSEKLISPQPPARVMNSENLRQTQTVKGFDLKTPDLDRNMSEYVWLKRNKLSMRYLWLKKTHTTNERSSNWKECT